jgi:hypothetical protein
MSPVAPQLNYMCVYIHVHVYCDMTPDSQNSSLLDNGDKEVPAEINTHVTVEELPFLCNGEVNIPL